MNVIVILRQVMAPLLSLFIFELGNGFFPTLLSLQMSSQGDNSFMIGAVASAFYAGLLLGAFHIETVIGRIGHIRAFAAFASSLTVLCILNGMMSHIVIWLALRFIAGIATAGIFVVIESWLLCVSSTETRGQILSFYMMSFYASQAVGQFMLNIKSSEHLFLFTVTAMLCSLSVIPLAMTRVMLPEYDEPAAMNIKVLYQKTASGLVGALCGGLIMGALYSLLPLVLNELFHSREEVSVYMFMMIVGGMVLQYPIGKLSDVVERRLVIIMVCLGIAAVSFLMELFLAPTWSLAFLIAIFGGLTFTVYPLSISYACDSLESHEIVAGIQALLIAYSVGAMIGPFLAPIFMSQFSIRGLFIFVLVVAFSLIIFLLYRKTQSVSMPQEEPFRIVPQTTPIVTELDPRQDAEEIL
jgi:MFS family permease